MGVQDLAPSRSPNSCSQETNRSFVLRAVRDVAFEDRPLPGLRDPWDVRVHIAQTGICGSDVHYWQRGRIGGNHTSSKGQRKRKVADRNSCQTEFILNNPIVLGHESSGTVVEVGSAVKNVKVGDRVAIEPGVPCRR